MPRIRYAETAPPQSLSKIVEAFWSVTVGPEGPSTPSHWVLPDGCATLSFRLGPNASFGIRPPALTPFRAPAIPGERSIGVRLRPGALARLNPETLSRLQACSLRNPPPDEVQGILEHQLHRIASEANDPEVRIERLVSAIRRSAGKISIRELSDRSNLSERQIERMAARALHLSPKEFARTTRLQAVMRTLIARPAASLAEVASEFAYADQAHMGREFIALGGLTPAAYRKMLQGFHFSLPPQPMSVFF